MGAGLALAQAYYEEVVAPTLARRCPDTVYAAARTGHGSEVLGLDDALSQDHDWGLRLQLFVAPDEVERVEAALGSHLPASFRGHPTRFAFTGQDTPRLGIDITTVADFVHERLGFDPTQAPSPTDWLSVSGQAALEVTGGAVFTDPTGELSRVRESLTWYPEDLWRYVVACDWLRLDQELPLMGRAADRGDELGSRVIAARLVDIAMHLAFLLGRRWPPYSKWRGTLFSRPPVSGTVQPHLEKVLTAADARARYDALESALKALATLQHEVGLPSLDRPLVPFWDRPYLQVDQSLVPAILDTIASPEVRALPAGVGSIEQHTDNVDVLVSAERRRAAVAH